MKSPVYVASFQIIDYLVPPTHADIHIKLRVGRNEDISNN
jgi:hypothetical protein